MPIDSTITVLVKIKSIPKFSRVSLSMGGKGDGKQKRDKTSFSPMSPSPSPPPPPIPQRVSNDINVPVRHQIKIAQMKKAAEKEMGSHFRQNNAKRTAYRKSLGASLKSTTVYIHTISFFLYWYSWFFYWFQMKKR
jgi:hypothetical protein